MIKAKLLSNLESYGYVVRIVSVNRLRELQDEIRTRNQQGLFDQEFYQERITTLEFNTAPLVMPHAKSIFIIAIPSLQCGVKFTLNGETKTLLLPPTYAGYETIPVQIEMQINSLLASTGYSARHSIRIPLKLLAVRSGLAVYGRNNITYVSGMGSFLHLIGLYSDFPCEQDEWQEAKILDRCRNCRACLIKCPTNAIDSERFLIRAECCITFQNEKPSQVLFPQWIDPSAHNSLIGCMICQKYCPENRKFKDRVRILAEFSEEETTCLLDSSDAAQDLPPAIMEKLDSLQIPNILDAFPRNLRVLFKQSTNLKTN
ncbi:MAG TPA: 4Fe-4S double cluster binding domain-containing protein [Anaerolineales bacterium]|nr:4Fe-4S double cluster binding domain-containing protein [Anaerolineales bacterium]